MSKQKELKDEHEIDVVVSGTAVGTNQIVLWVRAPNYEAFSSVPNGTGSDERAEF